MPPGSAPRHRCRLAAVLACVVNVSEGRHPAVLDRPRRRRRAGPARPPRRPAHHRAVLTLVGEDAPRRVATRRAVAASTSGATSGAHPRLGVVDVVPFVPLDGRPCDDAVAARDASRRGCRRAAVPCFPYGPDGPRFPTCGAGLRRPRPRPGPASRPPSDGGRGGRRRPGGARGLQRLAGRARPGAGPARRRRAPGARLRALGLAVGDRVQVSMNLVAPARSVRPTPTTRGRPRRRGRAELVGLVPAARAAAPSPPARWAELDLAGTGPSRPACEAPIWRAGRPGRSGSGRVRPAARGRGPGRRMRRRSRSLMPPQMPNFSPLARAYSRHSRARRTPGTPLWPPVEAPRSGKKRSGSTPRQLA